MKRIQNTAGFTLIELMVVVAIIGILAAVALPSYRDSVRKSNRTDAHTMLTRLSTLEEQYFFRNNQYTDNFANIVVGATSGSPLPSDEGHYSIALCLMKDAGCLDSGTSPSGWVMKATAVGKQAQDTECAVIIMNSRGLRTSKDSGGVASEDCW